MKVNLNLASHPFGWTRLFWTSSAVATVLLCSLTGFLVGSYVEDRGLPPEDIRLEAQLRAQLSELQKQETDLRSKLAAPENDQVLARSLFLNELLLRKGISWTRTFADLEEILPPRVQMVQIRPEVTIENDVLLDMQVGAETPKDFIEFLKVLESSEWFGSPDLRGFNPPTDNDPLFRYQLLVSYDQQL